MSHEQGVVIDRARLKWRARRGLLELDVVLADFIDQRYATLSARQRDALDRLLVYADAELWSWLNAQAQLPDAELTELVAAIRQHARRRA